MKPLQRTRTPESVNRPLQVRQPENISTRLLFDISKIARSSPPKTYFTTSNFQKPICSTMAVRSINDDAHFQTELSTAGIRLVVVDFTATWCGPCQRIAPIFESFPARYPKAIFLKVDVDKCQDTAAAQGVSAMPTFIFYRNKSKIDRLQGGNVESLQAKIEQHIGSGDADGDTGEDYGPGMMDLNVFVSKSECECLNEADDHPMENCLSSAPNKSLQSDCDEQLILSITFNQVVKIHSIKFKGPEKTGPKEVKLFINQPRTIDFDMGESQTATQDLVLDTKALSGEPVNLRYVKFQSVQNIQLFIKNNQSGDDVTQLDQLSFIGTPIGTTKMEDFKRIAGKKGQSH